MKQLPNFLRALSSRNYRLYLGGQCLSLIGNWMTQTAAMWLVYHLSASAFAVGIVVFANQFPFLLLAPFAGVLIDRTDALKIMRITQLLLMGQSAAMAIFTLTGHMTVPVLIGLSVVQGLINPFDFSCRQALVYELAGRREYVENVVALNSITFNLARLVGPAIAGFVIAVIGSGLCFAVDAAAYFAVFIALMKIHLAARKHREAGISPLAELREGVAYAWNQPAIRRILLMVSVICLAGFAHIILAPVFAKGVFHGGPRVLGMFLSSVGAGAIVAGLLMTSRESDAGLGGLIGLGAGVTGLAFVAVAFSPGMPLALVGYGAAGFGCSLVMIACNSALQMKVPDDKRGRVLSLYQTSAGFYPLGALVIGALAESVGPRATMFICGAASVAAAAVFAWAVKELPFPKRRWIAPA